MTEYDLDGAADSFGVAFPGQGNKREAMIEALRAYRDHPLVSEVMTMFEADDPEALDFNNTVIAQPATYAAGVAAVETAFGQAPDLPLVLGHSLGELTAAAAVGVISVRDGFRLAVRRGELCREQNDRRPGAMVAVMGADLHGIEWLRRQVLGRTSGILEVAGINSRRQTVLSGDRDAVERCVRIAGETSLLAEILPIGGSFHSPLMLDAVPAWREAVRATEFRESGAKFVSAVDARVHTAPDEIRELLVRALVLPVRWLEAVHTARREGGRLLWDAGPGCTLQKLGRRENIVTFASLADRPAVAEASK